MDKLIINRAYIISAEERQFTIKIPFLTNSGIIFALILYLA